MRLPILAIALLTLLSLSARPAIAQDQPHHIIVTRDGGAHLERGTIRSYDDVRYQVSVDAAGVLRIGLKSVVGSNLFNVYAPGTEPGKDEAIFKGASEGTKAELPLRKPGLYLIQVFLMRNAARRGTTSRYTLSVELTK
ncbi:hypothetical protein Terro_3665 [Terriglobus roseus DSM 18391]|uniref:DNA breaking-rejoining protein n=1 Tax=Terriglobus roseus (strain DSM 18391 / NRRL B-41598 / KBS 63) TaxID=926566 RepID=I3ZKW0_TERRK|nr:hypothetical protein [Terriglobus roseus]AFL89878.1 hypothetical protein Terro_3665 [Terriglobus roseus DSM 18391]